MRQGVFLHFNGEWSQMSRSIPVLKKGGMLWWSRKVLKVGALKYSHLHDKILNKQEVQWPLLDKKRPIEWKWTHFNSKSSDIQLGCPRNSANTEFRGIFWLLKWFLLNSGEIPRNSAEFRGISPELSRKSLPYSAECQNVTSVDTLYTTEPAWR